MASLWPASSPPSQGQQAGAGSSKSAPGSNSQGRRGSPRSCHAVPHTLSRAPCVDGGGGGGKGSRREKEGREGREGEMCSKLDTN